MHPFSIEDVESVLKKISPIIRRTPTISSVFFSDKYKANIALKLENLNVTGSFKIRGASNAILSADRKLTKNGIVAASAGNHAQGVAYCCRREGLDSTIFMPEATPFVKANRTRRYGAQIVLRGETYDDAYTEAVAFCKEYKMFMVHPFENRDVILGQATIALELLKQVEKISCVIVPVGGGGMISGIACALKQANPKIRIVGVQAESYSAMKKSYDSKTVVTGKQLPTIADGIAVRNVSEMTYDLISKYVDRMVSVSEEEIAQGIMELMEENRVVAEGAAATSVAALAHIEEEMEYAQENNGQIVSVVCGGNIDVNLLSKVVNRGLIHGGRLMELNIGVKDRPGGLSNLLQKLASLDANILQIHHERVFGNRTFQEVQVELELEVMNFSHQDRIKKSLIESGYKVSVI